jgi:hypothetical protein
MSRDNRALAMILGALVGVVFLMVVGVVAATGLNQSSVQARYRACSATSPSERGACLGISSAGVAAVNACNNAAANWSDTFPNSNSFPYWQQCMTDLLSGKTYTTPKTKGTK